MVMSSKYLVLSKSIFSDICILLADNASPIPASRNLDITGVWICLFLQYWSTPAQSHPYD